MTISQIYTPQLILDVSQLEVAVGNVGHVRSQNTVNSFGSEFRAR